MKRFTPVIIAIAGLALTACQNSETPSDIRNQLVSESNALEKLATEDQRARLSEPEITPVEAPAETPETDAPVEVAAEPALPADKVTADDVKESSAKAIEDAKAYATYKEQSYHDAIDQRVAAFELQLEQLRVEATEAGKIAKQRVSEDIAKVTAKIVAAQSQLAEVNQTHDAQLSSLQAELDVLLKSVSVPNVAPAEESKS